MLTWFWTRPTFQLLGSGSETVSLYQCHHEPEAQPSVAVTRSFPRRASALIWAVFFLLSTAGESLGLQPCPFHVSAPGSALQEAEPTGQHRHGHDHGHHQNAEAESSSRASHAHDDPLHAQLCTHSDACQTATGSVLPADLVLGPTAFFASGHAPVLDPADRLFVGLTPHFLPFSNGPPIRG
jgi:hypothetical protein